MTSQRHARAAKRAKTLAARAMSSIEHLSATEKLPSSLTVHHVQVIQVVAVSGFETDGERCCGGRTWYYAPDGTLLAKS